MTPGRNIPLDPRRSALLFIDVQNFCARRDGGEFAGLTEPELEAGYGWYFESLERTAVPKMRRLQAACREAVIEVMYTTIESLTEDRRDRSLDYRITGFNVPRGSCDGRGIDQTAPGDDEIWLPKGSSSVFISTTCCATWASASWWSAGS